jgi:hypothetical protein
LTRPLCSGEIVTAFKLGRVKVTRIECRNFTPPTGSQLADVSKFLDLSSCALEVSGICKQRRRLGIWEAFEEGYSALESRLHYARNRPRCALDRTDTNDEAFTHACERNFEVKQVALL